jgi:hypothetical protein
LYGDTFGANRSDCRDGVRGSFDRLDSCDAFLSLAFLGRGLELEIHLSERVLELADRQPGQQNGDERCKRPTTAATART